MTDSMLEYDVDKIEKRGISRYKAVIMAAQEARFVNDQIRLGILKSKEKPTTIALRKLISGQIVEAVEENV